MSGDQLLPRIRESIPDVLRALNESDFDGDATLNMTAGFLAGAAIQVLNHSDEELMLRGTGVAYMEGYADGYRDALEHVKKAFSGIEGQYAGPFDKEPSLVERAVIDEEIARLSGKEKK